MEYEQIVSSRHDDVAVLTLNRPERLNAWTPRMMAELTSALEEAEADPAVGAVVITGSGKGFCAGADISGFGAQLSGDARGVTPERQRDWIELVRSTKPIVGAINGVVVGVGLTMVLPFDRLVASDQARFSLRFVKMGLVPELASSHFLPQRVGFGAASDLMLSGRMIDANEALSIGLVDEVVGADALLETALRRARSYGENPAPQLRWIKQLLSANASETDTHKVQQREAELLLKAYATPEHKEAVMAFLEKRPPKSSRSS